MNRYCPIDLRKSPATTLAKLQKNNPYIRQIYEYPDLLLAHPDPREYQKLWQPLQQQAQKIHVEIGCGSGNYLWHWSQNHPQDAFLAFELRFKRLVLAAKKLQQTQQENVLLVKDRGEYLNDYLSHHEMDELHINFPDPWPKKKQKKHRLLCSDFLQTTYPLFRPQGGLRFKTDHLEYFHSVVALLRTSAGYEIVEYTEDLHRSQFAQYNIYTEFEKLFQAKDNPAIGYLRAQVHH